jgi:Uma2 family endonuclease
MRTFARQLNFSFTDYLELEETSQTKHEFYAGEIYAMAGGTPEHAALSMSVGGRLLAQLSDKPCTVFSSDLRVRVAATGLATYPDVTVVCGERQTDPESRTTVINPRAIVEVVSPSTELYDRGEKFEHYQQIEALEVVVFVSQSEPHIDVWSRREGQWQQSTYRRGDIAELGALGCSLEVDTVYSVL